MIFCTNKKNDIFLKELYDDSINELNEFYGINWKNNLPRLVVVKNRETINELKNKVTEDWVVGWAENKTVYVLDRENFEKESSHKYAPETYKALIKHELSHLFFSILSNNQYKPVWFNEGFAIYTSGQNEFRAKPIEFKSFLSFYNEGGSPVYSEAGYVIEILVKKFGKDIVLDFARRLPELKTEDQFSECFKTMFNLDLSYDSFNQLL